MAAESKKNIKRENYITVQGWMILDLGLKGNELLIYAIIYGFSQTDEQWFTGSRQYLADWTNSTKQGIQKCLNSLVSKGLIVKRENYKNGVKFCEYRVTELTSQQSLPPQETKFTTPRKQSLPPQETKFTTPRKQSLPNNIDNNIDNKLDDNIEVVVEAHTPQPPVITLLLKTDEIYPIMQDDIDTFKITYESIEPLSELKKISEWLSANPQKRRTAEETKLLIFRWLNEENQKARNNPATSKYPRKKPNSFNNFPQRTYDFDQLEKSLLTSSAN